MRRATARHRTQARRAWHNFRHSPMDDRDAPSDSERGAGALLATLMTTANERADASALLHEHVTLHRLDGERLTRRAPVVDAICTRESATRFRVLATHAEAVRVAMHIEGLDGHFQLTLTATLVDGVLHVIRMEA